MSDCWYMCDEVADRCAENRRCPNEPCSYETLARLGVHYKRYTHDELAGDTDALGASLLRELGYSAYDVIDIRRDSPLGAERFDALAAQHYQEHLHEDDEVRLIVDGCGYFDVRDDADRWVRVLTQAGDCIVVPAGIYHRFTTTTQRYTRAMRIFAHNPRWIAVPRPDGDALPVRQAYVQRLHAPPQTVVGAAEGATNDVYAILHPEQLDAQLTRILAEACARVRDTHDKGAGSSDAGDDSNKTQTQPTQPSSQAVVVVVLYVAGAAVPPHGESWCPDCVAAKPAIVEGVALLRAQLPHTRVLFVECPVQRANYRGNDAHAYRTHPVLRIRGVPTVFVLTCAPAAAAAACDGDALWRHRVHTVLRTEEPTVSEFAALVPTLQTRLTA